MITHFVDRVGADIAPGGDDWFLDHVGKKILPSSGGFIPCSCWKGKCDWDGPDDLRSYRGK